MDLAYNSIYVILIQMFLIFKDICMKVCSSCSSLFKPFGPEKGCSIKCKLLSGIKKTENGCWLFKKSTSGSYSKIRWKKKWYSAHRCSYEVFKGEIPEGKWVCHRCDIPKCINPDHLFIGSASENRKDCIKKGRSNSNIGENSVFAKFTDTQVEEMRALKKEGFTYERLSRIFNCSIAYLYAISKNKIRIGN